MSIKTKLQGLIAEANTTTGESDTNLTDAVASLIDGYGGSTPTGTKTITDTSLTDVSAYANAQVVDADLVAGNIKKGVNILGIEGTFEGGGGAQYATGSFTLASTVPSSGSTINPYTIVSEETIGFKPKVFIINYSGTYDRAVQSAIMCSYEDGKWISATDSYFSSTSTSGHYLRGFNNLNGKDISSLVGTLYYSNGSMNYNGVAKDGSYSYKLGEGTYTWYAYA